MSRKVILLAEPDSDARSQTRHMLEDEGYTVVSCGDAAHAMETVNRAEIAIVITELYMNGADDKCLVQSIRNSPALRRTKVLAYTTHGRKADRAWAIAEGADGYVLKKNGAPRLLEVVAHLGRSRRRRRPRPSQTDGPTTQA